ncbi:MAG: hypothetical protein ACRDO8_05300 [Nocardioidaceae bacterium]
MDLWSLLASLLASLAALVPNGPWAQTLDDLDARRNHAFVTGDAGDLRTVYAPGTSILAADQRMLHGFGERDLEVDRVSVRLLRVEVLRERKAMVRLRVVDRLRPVRVRAPGGEWRLLPRDRPTERTIVLRRTAGGWRIARATRLAG